jgi:plastocyanin
MKMGAMPVRSKHLAAAVAVVAVAAGGAAATQVADAAGTVNLSAAKNKLAFNVKTLHAKHGKITLRMANPSSFPHAIAIQGHGSGKRVGHGGTSVLTANLKKGTYTFFCPVPGHRAAGMVGKLVVS